MLYKFLAGNYFLNLIKFESGLIKMRNRYCLFFVFFFEHPVYGCYAKI